jgi:hypothetical protein
MILDKILFWVVLVWMIALLTMALRAVREVWKEDGREPTEPDVAPPEGNRPEAAKPNNPATGQ